MNTPSLFIRKKFFLVFLLCSQLAFSQSGVKWAVNGNAASTGDFIGTTNANWLFFRTNNIPWMSLSTTGVLQLNAYAGSATGFAWFDTNGNLMRTGFPNDPTQVLTGDGTFNSITNLSGWKIVGNDMFNLNSGFVGIGTNTPTYLLDVNGDARVNGTLYAQGLVLATKVQADTVKSTSTISINGNLNFYSGLVNDIYTQTGDVRLQSRVGYGGNTILNTGNNGNVGVGIYSPQYKFDVNGDARVSGKIITNRIVPLAGDSEIHFGDSSLYFTPNLNRIYGGNNATYKGLGLGVLTLPHGLFSTAIGHNVETGSAGVNSVVIGSGVGTNSTLANTIPNSLMIGFNSTVPTLFVGTASGPNTFGKVGIRTATFPLADFQVGDSYQMVTIGGAPAVYNTFSTSYIGFNVARTGPDQWETGTDQGSNGGTVLLNTIGGGFRIIGIPSTGNFIHANITDQDIANGTRFYINPYGRVIIGSQEISTSSPYDDAMTRMTVDGRILCKDLVVSTVADWPDFVFDSTYVLLPLDSVANFVWKNKHLPRSKPSDYIEKNGMSISETAKTQQQETEELLLYILQLDTRLKAAEAELATLKAKGGK